MSRIIGWKIKHNQCVLQASRHRIIGKTGSITGMCLEVGLIFVNSLHPIVIYLWTVNSAILRLGFCIDHMP